MDKKNIEHNGAGNGFLMGVIFGAVGTLLFTTKKGREIAKELTEKGLEKFSELEIALEEKTEEIGAGDYLETTEPIVVGKLKPPKDYTPKSNLNAANSVSVKTEKVHISKENKSAAPKTKVKRYFRLKKN